MGFIGFSDLLQWPLDTIRQRVTEASGDSVPMLGLETLSPCDGRMEVWAAGVTYERSQEARIEESEGAARFYALVYEAARPELFFKSAAWRVCHEGEPIGIREDSTVSVPEPELAMVINARAEIVGYTICNDVSSRSIEAENPLYLPQAKVYRSSCALASAVRPAWEIPDPYALDIVAAVERGGELAWRDAGSTAQLHRRLDELVHYLFRSQSFPDGVVLSTGTCLVPDLSFSLQLGDVVRIAIDGVGELLNVVTVSGETVGAATR
jgi:2-dehydro-3-deoxy-D-arabinonate dehydratase